MNKKLENAQKPKNFKSSIIRLFKELKPFRFMIIIAVILAIFGSILSIKAPNNLSKLTNEIQKGLILDSKNLKKISKLTSQSLTSENIKKTSQDILQLNINEKTINEILKSDKISNEDKLKFKEFLSSYKSLDSNDLIIKIKDLPLSLTSIILPTTNYKSYTINTSDKLMFIEFLSKLQNKDFKDLEVPISIKNSLFDSIKIDNTVINSADQTDFLIIMSNVNDKTSVTDLYKKLDEMPLSIQKVIKPLMNFKKIKRISLFLCVLYILSSVFTYIESLLMSITSNKFAKNLRSNISSKINVLPLNYFDNNSIGDILSRVTNDVDTIAQSMNQSIASLVSAVTLFIGTIIMMFYTNYILAFTAIGASLIGFLFMTLVLGKSQKYFEQRQIELGKLNGYIEEVYSGINIIKVYNAKETSLNKFDVYNQNVFDANRKSQFLSGLMVPMMVFIGNLGYVAVCIVGALLTLNNSISFGVIIAFIAYVRLFTSPLSQIAQGITSLQSTAAASERVFEFLDEKEMDNQNEITKVIDKENVKGNIEFRNVSFKYDNSEKNIINNFNVNIKAGQKVAIVGPTGAGKTTIVNLLMKFYDINNGDILIDGISTKELSRENIHMLFTMVLQDTWLFNGTVKENIKFNRDNISDSKVFDVCKTVGMDHFIRSLPNGYDTIIEDNDTISAGEKQLLTIARGMIEDAPFLILDEATSNVDTRTEELVQTAMDKLSKNKTSFIIAHRLSTIKNADLILVMKDGNIIEQGNHNKLMKENGFYADLYNSQFEL